MILQTGSIVWRGGIEYHAFHFILFLNKTTNHHHLPRHVENVLSHFNTFQFYLFKFTLLNAKFLNNVTLYFISSFYICVCVFYFCIFLGHDVINTLSFSFLPSNIIHWKMNVIFLYILRCFYQSILINIKHYHFHCRQILIEFRQRNVSLYTKFNGVGGLVFHWVISVKRSILRISVEIIQLGICNEHTVYV